MPNLRSILLPLNVAAFLAFSLHIHAATDGSWSSNASGNRDYGDTAYWAGSIIADGADAVALFNVNLTNDISVTNIMGRTLGHLYFQDTDTNSGSAGGWNLGSAGETALTLDVASGRSVIGVGNLNVGGGKKVSVIAPIANADGILKMGVGQLSIRAASPAFAADFKSAGGLTDTRSALANVTSLWLVNGAQFQVDFINAPINTVNLVNPAAPVTLGGNLLMPLPVIPPLLPLAATNLITGGATLTSSGRTNSVNTQVVASVTFNAGTHIVSVTTPGVNATNVFDPTNLSRNPGAVVNLTTSGAGLTLLMAGGLANDARGIIGGWAISGTNWAMVSPTNTIIPMTTYQTALSPASWAATDNVSLGTAASGPIGNQTINTLRVTATSRSIFPKS